MNIQKIRDFFHEIIDVLIYPFILIEKSEKASHRCNFAKKKKKSKPTIPNPNFGIIPAETVRAKLAKMNGTTPAQPTNRLPETIKRPNIHIGMIRKDKFEASLSKLNGSTPAKSTGRRTEKFYH